MMPGNRLPGTAVPDRDTIAAFLHDLFGYTEGFVPVRLIPEKGRPVGKIRSIFPACDKALADAVFSAAEDGARSGRGLFVVPATVEFPGTAKADEIRQTAVVMVDLDSGDIASKRNHLESHLGPASLVIASGGVAATGERKLHLYWKLTEAAGGEDLAQVAEIRTLLVAKGGADPSFRSLHQPIRVAGSIHGKHGILTPVSILERRDLEYDLGDLLASARDMPGRPDKASSGHAEPTFRFDSANTTTAVSLMTRPIREGGVDDLTRFEALSKVIGHWIRQVRLGNADEDQAWHGLLAYNEAMVRPPWPQERLTKEFAALLRKDVEEKGPIPVRGTRDAESDAPPDLSEDALAADFIEVAGADWAHVQLWGAWLHWTGAVWERDEIGLVRDRIRLTCRQCAVSQKPTDARRIASFRTISAVERITAADQKIAARTGDWNQDPMLLNTPSGVVDLETGEFRSHDRALRMTMITSASPGTGCPRWRGFLREITADDDALAGYLQRLAGYCLTGSTSEQAFFFLHGSGANGKSVFVDTLSRVLGSYATAAPLETFMASTAPGHSCDLAGLDGKRLVSVSETEQNRSWAETRIKLVTGGDPIRARFLYRDFFEFTPSFKLMVAGNHRPRLAGVGEAMRRRLHLVPFEVTIPADRRDPDLKAKLLAERDGILGWMIEGIGMWREVGLAPPERVLAAAARYFDDEDLIGQWIAEQCRTGPELRAFSAPLFANWRRWAEVQGAEIGSQRAFSEALEAHGFRSFRTAAGRGRVGLALRNVAHVPEVDT